MPQTDQTALFNPLVTGRKSSSMFTGVQPASYCTQLANFNFEGGYKHNEQPHQKLGQLNKNLIFGECLLFVTPCPSGTNRLRKNMPK